MEELNNFKEWDRNQWKKWIKKELENTEYAYLKKIEHMTGEYQREQQKNEEYNGRQLLELLQNADDAASESNDLGEFLIRLENNKLIVANKGEPFSPMGIKSLMNSNNSPKIKKANQIGYKGLGFRSILNWASSINIFSRNLSIAFSREHAKDFLINMLKKDKSIQSQIDMLSNEKYPIATLAVPKIIKSSDKLINLFLQNYDTVIILNINEEEVLKNIQSQINSLSIEVLLFLNNTSKIIIQSPDRKETIQLSPTSHKNNIEIQLINEKDKLIKNRKWKIYTKNGFLPQKLRTGDYESQFEYNLRIAVNKNINDNINRLFSYFLTEVKFPFPALVHGTFRLDGSRNHLIKDAVNEFLLDQLAELMVNTAINLKQKGIANWNSLRLLSKSEGDFDIKIEEMDFWKKLINKISKSKLIPIVNNTYMSVNEDPVFYKINFSEILKFDEFNNLAMHTTDDSIINLLKELKVGRYNPKIFISKLNKISQKLSIRDRAKLIALISDNKYSLFNNIEKKDMPNLLVDINNKIINSNSVAIMPPEKKGFQLPPQVSINFVNKLLVNELSRIYHIKESRKLVSKINCFNIQEYAFAPVISKIKKGTDKLIKKDPSNKMHYITEMVQSIWSIYSINKQERFPEKINIPLPTRFIKLKSANNLYFGSEYPNGKVMDNLYSKLDNSVFVAPKEKLGLENIDDYEVEDFLSWLGVAKYPRIYLKSLEDEYFDEDYEKYVLKNLKYPKMIKDVHCENYNKLLEDKQWNSVITIQFIDELYSILSNSNFEDILIWIFTDNRIRKIIENGVETNRESKFGLWFRHKKETRNIKYENIASYIYWKFITTKWIKTYSNSKATPSQCCLSKTLSDKDFSPLIDRPKINRKLIKLDDKKISLDDIDYILIKLGVAKDFSDLDTRTIYNILFKLPEIDPKGHKAKSIYRQIIENKKPSDIDKNDEKYIEFLKMVDYSVIIME